MRRTRPTKQPGKRPQEQQDNVADDSDLSSEDEAEIAVLKQAKLEVLAQLHAQEEKNEIGAAEWRASVDSDPEFKSNIEAFKKDPLWLKISSGVEADYPTNLKVLYFFLAKKHPFDCILLFWIAGDGKGDDYTSAVCKRG
jgi:hypothetical protein